jgi:O-antigen/teichoic acid export membrane protein
MVNFEKFSSEKIDLKLSDSKIPDSERKRVVKDSVQYFSATMIGQMFGLVRSILLPVLFTPTILGIWNLMQVVVNYGSNAHLGVLHGMNKLIPMLRGSDQATELEVENVKDNTFWVNSFLSFISFLCIWSASYFSPLAFVVPIRITSVIVLLTGIFYFYFSLLRADNRFRLVSLGVGGLSILSTTFVLIFAYLSSNPLYGALVGVALAYGSIILFWVFTGRYRYIFQIKTKIVKQCFRVGSPLLVLGFLNSIFISVDRWVIASNLEAKMLGYYAIAIMASSLIGIIPGSIASVLYPKMLERFGATGKESDLLSLVVGPERAITAAMSIVIGGAVIVLPFIVEMFMPKYLPSMPLLDILIPSAFFITTALIPGSFMVTINKQIILIYILIFSIFLALIFDMFVVKMGWGIIGIAWSTATVYAVYGISCTYSAARYVFKRGADTIVFLVEIYGVFVAMVIGLMLTTLIPPESETIGVAFISTILRLALFIAVLSPALWWSNRHGDVVREMFPGIFNKLKE